MTRENRQLNIAQEWEQARRALTVAEHLLLAGFHAESINRSYYAAFHAARAGLLQEGREPATHGGVRAEFARSFVHTGRFPAGLARALGSLQKEREDADYARGREWDLASAQEAFTAAREFVAGVEAMLRADGWLA